METLTVHAPSPSTNLPSYGNGAFSLSAPHVPGAGPLLVQVVYSFFQSPNMCLQALTQLEDYIKKHGPAILSHCRSYRQILVTSVTPTEIWFFTLE
uniref:Disrupted colicin M activity protein n=1 Tax=Escherichia coli TaxID=562 RepID=C3UUE3_ECOLX|nr:disrupted colicin M activity protein [Escherichia coli]ACO91572.1 disrupted colicin M activity protein [Escherichia coli]ACO91574.1 disrupted colicin M activity protein [Escherichia coli]ACO91576.1 disrupted colicin M activity protein [Escherichia coli]